MSQISDIPMSRKRGRGPEYLSTRKRRRAGGYSKYQSRFRPRPYPTVGYSRSVVPDRTMVKMKYSTLANIAAGAGQYALAIFRGNSIFDPDFGVGGHQPLGHDQWANFYEYYRVLSSSIRVDFSSQDTGDSLLCAIVPTEESVVIDAGNPDTYSESTYAKTKLLNVRGGSDSVTLVSYISTEKALGVHRVDSGFDEAAAFGSNPSAGAAWFWHVYVGTRSGAGSPNCDIAVTITYFVEIMKRKQLTAS